MSKKYRNGFHWFIPNEKKIREALKKAGLPELGQDLMLWPYCQPRMVMMTNCGKALDELKYYAIPAEVNSNYNHMVKFEVNEELGEYVRIPVPGQEELDEIIRKREEQEEHK